MLSDVFKLDSPLLLKMPLLFLALGYALTIKLRKSSLTFPPVTTAIRNWCAACRPNTPVPSWP